jgi:putative radical SAM enzyme (TIGR03279 family)
MPSARVLAVAPGSAAARAGVAAGDDVVSIDGEPLRDVIQYRLAADEAELTLELNRGGLGFTVEVSKAAGEPLGLDLDAAVFDRVRTCDNHCEFCFIYQLPKGMRRSLYLKDDDYRLSFLYGNFTTLTRFTEADLERVITERLSPLYVSIHATDPTIRAQLLRNKRGAVSLRWLRVLLDHGVAVHGQIVVCPGLNDGPVLEDTLCGVLDEYPELADVAVVPLGVSAHNTEPRMRAHTTAEAAAVVDLVEEWQGLYQQALGRRLVFAADEYYLLAGRDFPPAGHYGGYPMHEDGIGMARCFEAEFLGVAGGEDAAADTVGGVRSGFFAWSDGDGGRAPANPTGYQVHRGAVAGGCGPAITASPPADITASSGEIAAHGAAGARADGGARVALRPRRGAPVGVVTGRYGAAVLGPLLAALRRPEIRIVAVDNRFFGGNIGVAGLLTGADLQRALQAEPAGHRYLLPDVCLSGGRFLDGLTLDDLPRPVEVVPTDGAALRRALER